VNKKILKQVIRPAVSALLLGVIAWKTDWHAVGRAFAELRVGWFLAAALLLVVTQIVSTARWKCFADALRFHRPLRQLTGFYFIGMYFNLVLPTSVGGDVVRAWYLNAGSGRKLASLASVFLDRLNGLMVLVLLACLGTVFCPLALPPWMLWSVAGIAACMLVGMMALPFLARASIVPVHRRHQLQTMLEIMRRPRLLGLTTAFSVFVQVANVALVWMLGQSIAAEVPAHFYWILVPMVSLLTMLPISVNGMGLREAGVVLFLTPLGVPQPQALTLAFLWFAVYAVVSLLGGVVYLLGRFPKPQHPSEVTNDHGSVDRDSNQGRTGQHPQAA
jgi:uncharacterized membrane protein YbhN (UPF0104 family)